MTEITMPPELDWIGDDMDVDAEIGERYQELMDRQVANAFASILSSPEGRLAIWWLLDQCHVFSSTYTGNSAAAFLEGERNVGLKILKGHIFPNGHQVFGHITEEAEALHLSLLNTAIAQHEGASDD